MAWREGSEVGQARRQLVSAFTVDPLGQWGIPTLPRGLPPDPVPQSQTPYGSSAPGWDTCSMMSLRMFGRSVGWTCVSIGALQLLGGVRVEPGMAGNATVDSHVRFMGSVFAGYGLGWLDASAAGPDVNRMRVLAGLMALGGAGRLATRATSGRPHRFHDALLVVELAAPVVVESLVRHERRIGPVLGNVSPGAK